MIDSSQRQVALRELIENFLTERLNAKLEKLDVNDPNLDKLQKHFKPSIWIADAAKRAGQLQLVTHVLKATHPDARGTSLNCAPNSLPGHKIMGSHCLNTNIDDVVGNAAALDVYSFLRLKFDNKTLLEWMQDGDADLAAVMSNDHAEANILMRNFLGLKQPRGALKSHTLAKQLYWLTGDDPSDNNHYHLLAPLYASSLAHRVFEEIKEHRFGDVAKTARESKRHNEYSDVEVHEYRNLAIQKLGGTKPQNISQLNSERRGENYLLASLPPIWKRRDVSAPFGATTIFKRFGRRRDVFLLIRDLKKFLESKPPVTTATREQRDYLLNRIKDYLYQYVGELHELEPGWSANKHCELSDDEKLWLDPLRATSDADFAAAWHRGQWIDEIKARFASWLNHALGGQLPFGDVEHTFWSDVFDDETWRQQIDAAKRNLQAREKSHV